MRCNPGPKNVERLVNSANSHFDITFNCHGNDFIRDSFSTFHTIPHPQFNFTPQIRQIRLFG